MQDTRKKSLIDYKIIVDIVIIVLISIIVGGLVAVIYWGIKYHKYDKRPKELSPLQNSTLSPESKPPKGNKYVYIVVNNTDTDLMALQLINEDDKNKDKPVLQQDIPIGQEKTFNIYFKNPPKKLKLITSNQNNKPMTLTNLLPGKYSISGNFPDLDLKQVLPSSIPPLS
jgi:hypothetical protein